MHPEHFARLLAGQVVTQGEILEFRFRDVPVSFIVMDHRPRAPAVYITSKTKFRANEYPFPREILVFFWAYLLCQASRLTLIPKF